MYLSCKHKCMDVMRNLMIAQCSLLEVFTTICFTLLEINKYKRICYPILLSACNTILGNMRFCGILRHLHI